MYFSAVALFTALLTSTAFAAEPIKAIATFADPTGVVTGSIRFIEQGKFTQVYANISGLTAGDHGIHIHAFGDLSNGCVSLGPHYNPHNVTHGGPDAKVRHPGDFGNIVSQGSGFAILNLTSDSVKLSGPESVLGRGIVVHSGQDDLGLGNSPLSNSTGNSGERVACGVIGFSST